MAKRLLKNFKRGKLKRTTGRTILLEFHGCKGNLTNLEEIKKRIKKIARKCKMKIYGEIGYFFGPGITHILIIAESHFATHTWPESNFARINIETCSEEMDWEKAVTELKRYFKPSKVKIKIIKFPILALSF